MSGTLGDINASCGLAVVPVDSDRDSDDRAMLDRELPVMVQLEPHPRPHPPRVGPAGGRQLSNKSLRSPGRPGPGPRRAAISIPIPGPTYFYLIMIPFCPITNDFFLAHTSRYSLF